MRQNIFKKLITLAMFTIFIHGCAVAPKMSVNEALQIKASTPKSEGQVEFFTVGQWMPNSKEFIFAASKQTPKISGVVVLTTKSILFEEWGGAEGLSVIKKINFADIKELSMITFGRSGKIVILDKKNQYNSFAASDHKAEISIRKETAKMYDILLSLIKDDKPKELTN